MTFTFSAPMSEKSDPTRRGKIGHFHDVWIYKYKLSNAQVGELLSYMRTCATKPDYGHRGLLKACLTGRTPHQDLAVHTLI